MNRILPWLLLCALLVAGAYAACSGGDAESNTRPPTDDDTGDDDASFDDDLNDDDFSCPNPYCVIEQENPGADWDCESSVSCTDDYLTFVDLAADYAAPITEAELDQQMADIENELTDVHEESLPASALAETLVDILNVDFLRDGLDQRWLRVTVTDDEDLATYRQKRLLLEDPYVGTFKALLLLPPGEGPFPAVIALHGHADSAVVYRDDYHGDEYPARGFAILMITSRAMGADYYEDLVTRHLLLAGFTFMGLRHYETILLLKYLQYLPEVDNDRVGLIGHSGGSVAGNLTAWIEDGFGALVTDEVSTYYSVHNGLLHDDNVPALYPYHPLVNDFENCPVPVRRVDYGYTGGMDEIFNFFNDNL
ncbi:MAG: alpha/beta hydrolase family protein [Alphaproteobacteria bacterium]